MKISLCIPQYNRIQYLLKICLISPANYPDMEVVISDDASTDNTEEEINKWRRGINTPLFISGTR